MNPGQQSNRKPWNWACSILLCITIAACGDSGAPTDTNQAPEPAAQNDVQLAQGWVRGIASPFDPDITVFRGLPYAAPPVGDRRWQPPAPATPWQGILQADTFGASCYQAQHTSSFVWRREAFTVSEDCLYLNIWTPKGANNLPVMVWFHGGAHVSGQGHSLIFDGTELARQGVIVVTVNYRLGPFGFLAHPWLAEESATGSAGNYGLMDKIAALNWVQTQIDKLGGNPNNVTIFGQSAGSQSVCALMASPLATGLFHRAIGQSAPCPGHVPEADTNGMVRGGQLVEATDANSLVALRRVAPEALLAAAETTRWDSQSRITVDGWVLPEPPAQRLREGRQAKVPLLLGSLANEGVELFPLNPQLTESELAASLGMLGGARGHELAALYAPAAEHPGAIEHAASTDFFMAFGMQRWAEYQARIGQPTFLYFMDHVPPAFHLYMPEKPELELPGGPRSAGAYHSGDLALVFGTVDKVGLHWTEQDRTLSRLMVRYWTNFAKTGDPNGANLPVWLPFSSETANTQRLDDNPVTVPGIRQAALTIMAEAHPP